MDEIIDRYYYPGRWESSQRIHQAAPSRQAGGTRDRMA